jgi:HD-GYP domain-containing protein (c-di-GMP phosphodiesterase class II)
MADDIALHGQRSAWLCARLCAELGMPGAQILDIARAAQTHDIGKYQLPAALLEKPSALTPEEYETIKQHCVLGAQHLGSLAEDTAHSSTVAVAVALSHHEWWNGSGYPFGLAGSAIPRCARIVAVVDVFDALISERPYKNAWSLDATLSYIAQRAGTQVEPDCVDALLACAWDLPQTWRTDAQSASLELLADLASPRFVTPSPSNFVGLWPQDA